MVVVSGATPQVFKGFYGNPGVKSFLPQAKTPDLYAYIRQRECLDCLFRFGKLQGFAADTEYLPTPDKTF